MYIKKHANIELYKYFLLNKIDVSNVTDICISKIGHFSYDYIAENMEENILEYINKEDPSEIYNFNKYAGRKIVADFPDLLKQTGYINYLITNHNDSIPNSYGDALLDVFEFNNSDKYIDIEFKNENDSDIQTYKKLLFWSNKIAKLYDSSLIHLSRKLYKNDPEIAKDPKKLLSKSKEIYRQYNMKYPNTMSIDNTDNFLKYVSSINKKSDKDNDIDIDMEQKKQYDFLISIMGSNNIPHNKAKTFINSMNIAKGIDDLYRIKYAAFQSMLIVNEKEKNQNMHIYASLDEYTHTKDSNNDKFSSTYRVVIMDKGDYSPTVLHVCSDQLDDFLSDTKINIRKIPSLSVISDVSNNKSYVNFKLSDTMSKKLEGYANRGNYRAAEVYNSIFFDNTDLEKYNRKEGVEANVR